MDNWKYNLIGIGYSMQCPKTRQFANRVRAITRWDKTENVYHIDNDFKGFGHEFLYHGERFMIEYHYYDFGYQASVYSCDESAHHDLRG